MSETRRRAGLILVLYDGSDEGARAVETAGELFPDREILVVPVAAPVE